MRDIFLIAVLPLLLFAIIKRPFIGLGLWIWTAMFFPNAWVYGFAGSIRYNLLFTGMTIVTYLASKDKDRFQPSNVGRLVLVFFVWATISSFFGLAYPEVAWEFWTRFVKVILLFVFILLVMNKKLHIDFFLWCLALSIGSYAGLEGLKYIVSGGRHQIAGFHGHVLGDRNDLALSLAMMLPICFYLLIEFGKKSWIIKYGLVGMITLIVTSIIGTGSRGGLVALSAVGGYLFLKSKHKIIFLAVVLVIGSAMIGLIPDQWYERMDTIGKANSDGSFMTRVVAWKLSFILAIQHPFLGGGFKALETHSVWYALSQEFFNYPYFYSGTVLPEPAVPRAAHSIYFQVLGDHGFIGLFFFLAILILSFLKAGQISRKVKRFNGPVWISNLSTMLQLVIFAYAVGGAALSMAYFELIYAVCAIIIVLETKFLQNALPMPNALSAASAVSPQTMHSTNP